MACSIPADITPSSPALTSALAWISSTVLTDGPKGEITLFMALTAADATSITLVVDSLDDQGNVYTVLTSQFSAIVASYTVSVANFLGGKASLTLPAPSSRIRVRALQTGGTDSLPQLSMKIGWR